MTNMGRTDWTLIFFDDFSGTVIDSEKWDYPYRPYYIGQDVFAYCAENVTLRDGCLEIRAEKKEIEINGKVLHYRSGSLKSIGCFEQKYGRFEARIRFSDISGLIPAFWMMPGTGHGFLEHNGDGAEIDIMEHIHSWRDHVSSTAHWGGYGEGHKNAGEFLSPVVDPWEWHEYAREWNAVGYRFFVDGIPTVEYSGEGVSRAPEYILLSMAMGGWGGKIHDADLPGIMLVDWIRAYSRSETGIKTM